MEIKCLPVGIAGTGSFLPGDPIPNDRLEEFLGPLTDAPPKVRKFIENVGPVMLASSGVEKRHFAIDSATGDMTHSFAQLAEPACRHALEMAGVDASEIDLLLISCPAYDYSTPPTSTYLQEQLGVGKCAEMEIHSNCSGVGKSVQIAYDALRVGRYKTALVAYPQLSSVYLRSCYFTQSAMDKVHAALRWILADGAGAAVLRAGDAPGDTVEHEILGTYVESVGYDRKAAMIAGGGVANLLKADHQLPELVKEGQHHLWQDFSAVNRNAGPLLLEGMCAMLEELKIDPAIIDHYVASIPTMQLYEGEVDKFCKRFLMNRSKMKFRASQVGYCGGAAILLHLDQMVRDGELTSGQHAVVHSVESSKWMTAGFVVRW